MTPERRTVRLMLAALLVPAALVLGACGGSDDSASPTTTAGGAGTSAPAASDAVDDGATGDFCARAKALEGKDDVGPAEAVAGYQSLVEVAPDEVRPDLETMIEYFESVPSGNSDPAKIEEFAELSKKFADASARAVRYVNENC